MRCATDCAFAANAPLSFDCCSDAPAESRLARRASSRLFLSPFLSCTLAVPKRSRALPDASLSSSLFLSARVASAICFCKSASCCIIVFSRASFASGRISSLPLTSSMRACKCEMFSSKGLAFFELTGFAAGAPLDDCTRFSVLFCMAAAVMPPAARRCRTGDIRNLDICMMTLLIKKD